MPVGRNGVVPSALNVPGQGQGGTPMPSPGRRSPMPRSPAGTRQPPPAFAEEQMYANQPGANPVSAAAKLGAGAGRGLKNKMANIGRKSRGPPPVPGFPGVQKAGAAGRGAPAGGYQQPQYAQQQQPYIEDDDDDESDDESDEEDDYAQQQQQQMMMQQMPQGRNRNMSQNQMMMQQQMMQQQQMQQMQQQQQQMMMPPPPVAMPPPSAAHGMPPGFNGQMQTTMMNEKMGEESDDDDESEEESDDDDMPAAPTQANYAQQQQQQQQAMALNPTGHTQMGPMGPVVKRPHCEPMCWWKGNRSWERIKAMNMHMKVMFGWIQVAGLMHGLLSMLFSFAWKDMAYQSGANAVSEKDVAGGLVAGIVLPGAIGLVYNVIGIYCLKATLLSRPVTAAAFVCCLTMLIFSLSGPPKLLLGSINGDPNLDTGLLRVCAVWSFIVTVMNLLTIPITWYCQRSWIRFLDTYGMPEPFIRRHICKDYRTLQAAYENYGGAYQGAAGVQSA